MSPKGADPLAFDRLQVQGSKRDRVACWLYAEYHGVPELSVYPPDTIPWDEAPKRVRDEVFEAADDLLEALDGSL